MEKQINNVELALKTVFHHIESSSLSLGIKEIEKIIAHEARHLEKRADKAQFNKEVKLILAQYVKGWFIRNKVRQ